MTERDLLLTVLPEGWEVAPTDDLVCPCGYTIEQDGECPEGHVSPLRLLGLLGLL